MVVQAVGRFNRRPPARYKFAPDGPVASSVNTFTCLTAYVHTVGSSVGLQHMSRRVTRQMFAAGLPVRQIDVNRPEYTARAGKKCPKVGRATPHAGAVGASRHVP